MTHASAEAVAAVGPGHAAPRVVTFITGHYALSARRAGFHNLADAAYRAGHRVNFVTAGYSLLSHLRRDYRTRIPGIREHVNRPVELRPGFVSYVHSTPWHPHTLILPVLNRLTMSWMDRYGDGDLGGLLPLVRATDVFVFESMAGLFLVRRFRRENPAARMVYRVSDDVRILGSTHPRLVELEREIAPLFDCVSVPSSTMLALFPGLPSLRLDKHGLDTAAYDACLCSPSPTGSRNAVFIGTGYLDAEFLRYAATADTADTDCCFHVIGPMHDSLGLPNVRFHGEMFFAKTLPYVKFADVGLMNLLYRNASSRSFSDSLKIIQYRYCGLPIVSPDFIDLHRDGVFYYRPGRAESCGKALREALACGRDASRAAEVRSWDETFQNIMANILEDSLCRAA
jgi:2-beta-glucuronyltransferase